MSTTFTKGQQVHYITSWNDKGTFYVQPCEVYSCGKKQMILNSAATGECVGRNFLPQVEQHKFRRIEPNITLEQAKALALQLAADYIAYSLARMQHQVDRAKAEKGPYTDGYVKSMEEDMAVIRANGPQVIDRT